MVDLNKCKLKVPEASIEDYKTATVWKDFFSIESGINNVQADGSVVTDFYTIDGQHRYSARKGLNIMRTKDGQTRKVVVR